MNKVMDRPVDVVLPSHAGHAADCGFVGIADGKSGSGERFVDSGAWKRMLTAKRAENVRLMEQSET